MPYFLLLKQIVFVIVKVMIATILWLIVIMLVCLYHSQQLFYYLILSYMLCILIWLKNLIYMCICLEKLMANIIVYGHMEDIATVTGSEHSKQTLKIIIRGLYIYVYVLMDT